METTYRSYSQRNGHEKIKPMQDKALDAETRMAIWNVFAGLYHKYRGNRIRNPAVEILLDRYLFEHYLKAPLDNIGEIKINKSISFYYAIPGDEMNKIHQHVLNANLSVSQVIIKMILLDGRTRKSINQIFDILEIAIRALNKKLDIQVELIRGINEALRQNRTVYRVQESCGLFMKVANEAELEAINKAAGTPHERVNDQINDAIKKYHGENYNDCVAVTSNALESILKIMADTPKGTASDALKKLRNDAWYEDKIHESMKKAIESLYGYASDTVRHGQKDDAKDPTESEALFVLVTCSSVINYLVSINKDN